MHVHEIVMNNGLHPRINSCKGVNGNQLSIIVASVAYYRGKNVCGKNFIRVGMDLYKKYRNKVGMRKTLQQHWKVFHLPTHSQKLSQFILTL